MANDIEERTRSLGLAAVLVAAAIAGATAPARSQEVTPRRILVLPFENLSGTRSTVVEQVQVDPGRPARRVRVDRYSQRPRVGLETIFADLDDLQVIERQRVDQLLEDPRWAGFRGGVDEAMALRLGQTLDATTVVTGRVVEVRESNKVFRGSGGDIEFVEVRCRLSIRAVDVATTTLLAAGQYEGRKVYPRRSFAGSSSGGVALAVLDDAIAKLEADKGFREGLFGQPAETVEIAFEPTPERFDVFIDDEYRGTAPMKLRLRRGQRVSIEIRETPTGPAVSPRPDAIASSRPGPSAGAGRSESQVPPGRPETGRR